MKIGVIGPRDKVMCYMSAGFSVYEADDGPAAAKQVKKAADDDCAVIFITPSLCELIKEQIDKYSQSTVPAIIPLPEKNGGLGTAQLKNAVERAVGADIIFNDKK